MENNIRSEMFKGVFWSATEKFSNVFVVLIVSAILARLISPREFGIVAIATVIINFLTIFSTMGIFPAIIQRRDLSSKDYDSIFTFTIILGLLFSFLFYLTSWKIATYYHEPSLIPICHILSIALFCATINLVPSALMAKNKRFKLMAKRAIILQLIGGGIAVAMAFYGCGVYALLVSPIISFLGAFIINIYYYPCHLRFPIDFQPLKKIFSYSAFQLSFDVINFFSRNLDKAIIGKYLNMQTLGYYDKSYRLMLMPISYISAAVSPVLQPILSDLQDSLPVLANKYSKVVHFIAMISFPLATFIFFTAYELINIVYGHNWDAAIPTFKILSLSLPLQMIITTTGAIYQASNATKHLFIVGLINTLITIVGFYIAICVGESIEAVAISWDITLFLNFTLTFMVMYKILFKSPLRIIFSSLAMPFLNALLLIPCFLLLQTLPLNNLYVLFILKVIISLTITLLFLQLSKQISLKQLYQNIKSRCI
jgi:hypothetical protein|nr:lipopolysaccharide biosynthesis protein [uncultured Prevotella sp.]